jgi:RNA polymerase sigma-70 factor (ECF subfamily)
VVVVTGLPSANTSGQVARSDAAQFAALVEPHMPRMLHLAERLAGADNKDDVVQEALINAWRKRAQFNAERGSLGGWLMAIVADQARKSWRRKFVFFGQLEAANVATAEDRLDLEAAVSRLPGRQRLAVDCHYFAGLSVAETATVMRCSEGTVKSTLSDARRSLRGALEADR